MPGALPPAPAPRVTRDGPPIASNPTSVPVAERLRTETKREHSVVGAVGVQKARCRMRLMEDATSAHGGLSGANCLRRNETSSAICASFMLSPKAGM